MTIFAAAAMLAAPAGALEQLEVESRVLGETRTLLVRVPEGYATGDERYPVLYLTDGESSFDHVRAEIDFLERNRRIPKTIVVAVTNTRRVRDLTPTARADRPGSGGSETFLDFFEKELIPTIDARYRTVRWRIFAGHSLGGLFSLWTLATRPALFDAYIAISPSLHYDDGVVMKRLEASLASMKKPTRLFVTVGNEGPESAALFAKLEKLLKRKAPRSLDWEARTFPDEDHGSVALPSHYYGLRRTFSDYPVSLQTANGPVDDPIRHLDSHFARLSKTYGWDLKTPEAYLNELGYRELAAGNTIRAIEILADNVRRYPRSPNVYDSLGEAYELDGALDKAREQYRKAAELAEERNDPLAATFRSHYERVAKP